MLEVSLLRVVLLLGVGLGLGLGIGVGEHGVGHPVVAVHARDGLLGGDRVVLQRHRGVGGGDHVRDGGTDRRGELWERLLAVHDLREHGHIVGRLDVGESRLGRRARGVEHVIGAQLVVRDGGTRVHGGRVRGRRELLVLQREGGLDAE